MTKYNNYNHLFYQESNTFRTIILKHFTKRTQLPKALRERVQIHVLRDSGMIKLTKKIRESVIIQDSNYDLYTE